VSPRGTQFISKFWERLHETIDTHLNFSSAYHPQTVGQTKKVTQILENVMRVYAMQYERSCNKSALYVEFSFNNSYRESLEMTSFGMLYGHWCRTLLFWNKMGERKIFDSTFSKMS
jgi:hypothetical protein